ncbi:hypothetical protein ACTFIV_010160 [Dictyostelium citrinum]
MKINIYYFFLLVFGFIVHLSFSQIVFGPFVFSPTTSFYAIGGNCEFDVSCLVSDASGLDTLTWAFPNEFTNLNNVRVIVHNETAQLISARVNCAIDKCSIAVRANSTNGLFLFQSTSPICEEIPPDFTIEKISAYSYNYFTSAYSCYVNVSGLFDDFFFNPKLLSSDIGIYSVSLNYQLDGRWKLTFLGAPTTIAPTWFFQYADGSPKFNITSPFNSSISYENSAIIDYFDSSNHKMNSNFDYPQFWINIKTNERYPYINLRDSFFLPKIVSSNDDGSLNYFINARTIITGNTTCTLSLQNYSSIYQVKNNYQYEDFKFKPTDLQTSKSIVNENDILTFLNFKGENFTSRNEIEYNWQGGKTIYESFPFGFGSGHNLNFNLDISILTMQDVSNDSYSFSIGSYSYSFSDPLFKNLSAPLISKFNILDTFSDDDNKVLFRFNYSTPNGISKIELYHYNGFNDGLENYYVYLSTDFNIVSGGLNNGIIEFIYTFALLQNHYIILKIYDSNSEFTTLKQNSYYQSFLDTLSFPQLYEQDYDYQDFNAENISSVSFFFNDVNLTNANGYNIMYLETYDTPLTFEPCLQIIPQWDNITIKGEWVNSRYEFIFYMPPNIANGAFEYAIKSPNLQYVLNTELPDEFQLNVISDRVDLMGPIVTTLNKTPSIGVASIDSENYSISWAFTITDYNGFDNGYVVVIGSIDNILYNFTIISPIKYSNEFTYQIDITLNNNTCISQTYSIAEMVLYDRYRLNSTFYLNKAVDFTPNINPLFKIGDRNLYSIETECPGGNFTQPELKSFDFEPKSIDVGSLNRDVIFTYGISIGSGIKEYPIVYLTSTTLEVLKCNDVITTPINSTFNEYKCKLTLPYGFGLPKNIMVNLYGLIGFGSYFGYSSYSLQQSGYPFLIETSFTLMNSDSGGIITGTSSISIEGGSLFIYGRFPLEGDYNVEFSKGYSLTPSKKSGSIIKVEGVKPSSDPFTISIKNGITKSNLYTVTPYRIGYIKTILPSKCKGTPICGGPTQGTCNDVLGCICNSPWVGVDCSSKVIIVPQPVFNTSSPTIKLNDTTSGNSDSYIIAEINVVAIRETDFNNKVLHMYSFDKWIYNSINSNVSTYSSNIVNKNGSTTPISVNIEYFENEKTIEFADQEINMKPSSIKYTINIDQYPFSTRLTQLQLILSATAISKPDSDSCSNKEFDNTTSESSDYVKLSLSSRSLYGRFIRRALVDSTPITISNELLDQSLGAIDNPHTSQSFIGINIPIYNKNVIIDPDFSLIINSNPSTNENSICFSKSTSTKSGLTTAQLAGIIVGSVGAVAIVFAVIVTIKRKRALKKEMKVFGKKLQAINN